MIIVLKPHPTPEVIEHVLERIEALGFTPHLSQGVARTIIGVIGDEDKLQVEPLQAIPGVEQVVPILKPYKLASREFHAEESVFEIKGVRGRRRPPADDRRAVRDRGRGDPRSRSPRRSARPAPTSCGAGRSSPGPAPTASRGSARTASRSSRRPASGSACRS